MRPKRKMRYQTVFWGYHWNLARNVWEPRDSTDKYAAGYSTWRLHKTFRAALRDCNSMRARGVTDGVLSRWWMHRGHRKWQDFDVVPL